MIMIILLIILTVIAGISIVINLSEVLYSIKHRLKNLIYLLITVILYGLYLYYFFIGAHN